MTIRVHHYDIRDGWPVCKYCGTVRPKTGVGEPAATGPRWCPGVPPKIKTRETVDIDCGQNGPCATPPGCMRHWEERNRELVEECRKLQKMLDVCSDVHLHNVKLKLELDRFRKLFDDAGQGEYNVLGLIDHYQRDAMESNRRLRAVRKILEKNGCECLCDHHADERGPDCDVCLACLIGEVVGN